MVRTWGWAYLAAMIAVAALCPAAHGVPAVRADAGQRACVDCASPQPGSRYINSNQPSPIDDREAALAMPAAPERWVVLSYVLMVALWLAAMCAMGVVFVLVIAAVVVKIGERPKRVAAAASRMPGALGLIEPV